ncbi:hypothetical protein GWN91_07765, partial [Candidatus Saccharibacteria bacterium]|nr:hypothetical protein [Candidatus Saccharibacteria bacterium]NIV73022.1 hypothetical protein [Calditrichia bacterium]
LQLAVQHHKKLREQKEEVAKADQEKQTEAFEKKMRDMAKIYEKMNSEEAAKIISNLEIEIAVSVLVKMRKRKAAKVMENLEPAQAVKISKYMAVQEQ